MRTMRTLSTTSPCTIRITTSSPRTTSPTTGVVPVQIPAVAEHDAPLRRVRVGSAVGHVERARVIVAQPRVNLVGKLVARSTRFLRLRHAGLDHVPRHHAMKYRSVVERPPRLESRVGDRAFGEADEVRHRHRRELCFQPRDDQSLRCADLREHSVLRRRGGCGQKQTRQNPHW